MKEKIKLILLFLFVYFFVMLNITGMWAINQFGNLDINNIIFNLTTPLEDANTDIIYVYIFDVLLNVKYIIFSALILFFVIINFKKDYLVSISIFKKINIKFFILKNRKKILIILLPLITLFNLDYNYNLIHEIKYYFVNSDFIENNYVNVDIENLTFPEESRNLIHIVLESVETSMTSIENGGAFENDYIPNLMNLADEYISFTTNSGGGIMVAPGTGWTVASLFAQTSGLPFYSLVDGNGLGIYESFLPGAQTIGEILDTQNYNQLFLLGSSASYAGRDVYFESNNYEVKDYDYAVENEMIDSDYYVFWGYEDGKLIDFAKDELTNLASKDDPFNFMMLTVNTHFIDGYLEDDYVEVFDTQYENVIYNSDAQVYELVTWIMEQDFYENTTIVITGDHLTMQNSFFDDVDDNYERTIYNVFINSAIDTEYEYDREFYTMDMYPTILASMGITIEDDRLALGTNLFSGVPTIYEEFGSDYVYEQLSYKSNYYYQRFYYED